ncbi:ABC transporter ATP-binding protein [Ottowia thiooxydans]|uniref:ABC transporter ATP-binding protein n=1 Tax=Ottowia thiooxydans TaxID=219182 RepID=UPI00041D470E|nr:ABC transporter ATP-binding protein [Ottowia thiooxydans]
MRETLKKVWALFAPAEQRKAIWMLLLVILMAMAETAGVLSIVPFLSVLARPAIVHENRWLSSLYEALGFAHEPSFIVALGLTTMAVVIASSTFKALTFHVVGRFVHMQRQSLGVRLLSTYLRQPYEFFLARNSSELTKSVLSEVDQLIFDLLQPLFMLIAQGTVVVAMVVLVFAYDPWMAICIVAAVGLLYGAIYLLVRQRLSRIGSARQMANTARYKSCSEVLGGIKDVKITHATDAYLTRFSHASREFSRHSATAETLSQSPLYIVEAVGYTGLILIALVLLWRSGDMAQVLPALGLYGFAAYRLLPAVQIMYRGLARLRFSSATLDNIHEDLSLPQPPVADQHSHAIAPLQEIRLQGILYAYPSAPDKPVLEGFDLVIPANTSVGIAGRSGAGKSTLMDILLGLLQPQAGTLSVDGIPIVHSNVAAWQRAIGYVPQHIYLADASVAENIAFGVPKHRIDMQAVQRAARTAQIHDFIERELAEGYGSVVGDRGIRLSGGQRQRIGIARALYHDPAVLFMDEATSALDTDTEEALNAAIRNLSGSKTILVIAHREASLRACDTVISMGAPTEEPRETNTHV